jgi:hypothetical protein
MVALFLRRQQNILDYALSSLWRSRLKNLLLRRNLFFSDP